jgi:hypothetical protein
MEACKYILVGQRARKMNWGAKKAIKEQVIATGSAGQIYGSMLLQRVYKESTQVYIHFLK